MNQNKPQSSLRKRYFFKLIGNLFAFISSLIVTLIVPRTLGPVQYGNFSFLTNFFQQFCSFLDMSVSQAYFTKLSQRPKDEYLIQLFWLYSILFFILMSAFLLVAKLMNWVDWIWPDQEFDFVVLAAGWGFLMWFSSILNKKIDAFGLTVGGEILHFFQSLLKIVLLLVFVSLGILTLRNFFVLHYMVLFSICCLWIVLMKKSAIDIFPKWSLTKQVFTKYFNEFYEYCHPLVFYTFICVLANILDRWLLQKIAGSVEQSYFGLAFQISTIAMLFSSAMTPLFLRELAIFFEKKDFKSLSQFVHSKLPIFVMITAFITMFLTFHADIVTQIVGGEQYEKAAITIALMSLYPLHQTYGQLSSSIFLATNRTKTYRNIGIVQALLGIILYIFLVFPKDQFGLELGAFGLALKVILVQFIGVYVGLLFNCQYLKLKISYFFKLDCIFIGLFGIIAFGSKYFLTQLGLSGWILLVVSSLVYLTIILGVLWMFPKHFPVNLASLTSVIREKFAQK